MTSVSELERWIDGRDIALVSGRSAIGNAAEAIAGRPIDGSWWGDPLGSVIFRLLNELEDGDGQYLDIVLAEGKRTLVSQRIAPVVLAVASDPERRRRVAGTLKEPAQRLLEVLADGGVVRSDDPGSAGTGGRNARTALEAALLARSTSVHTVSGHHASVLESYGLSSPSAPEVRDGLRELLEVALRAAVVAERAEAEKWFRFVEPDPLRRAAAVAALGASEIHAAGREWLTLEDSA
jgi:hypothetical protein